MSWRLIPAVWTLLLAYTFWRMGSVPCIARRLSGKAYWSAAFLFWGSVFAGMLLGHDGGGGLARALEICGMHGMATLMLVFTCLLAVTLRSPLAQETAVP